VIAYRHVDPRYPFLWETAEQPAARWHGEGEGPAQYFADTPEGAWAEYLRHEGIVDPSDVSGIRRAIWAIELPDSLMNAARNPSLALDVMKGGLDSYTECRDEARQWRQRGVVVLVAPSAALLDGGASGWLVDGGLTPGPARDGQVVVMFERQPTLVGWSAVNIGQPDPRILPKVRPL
jgi:RES domain-containing protein